MSRIRSRPLFIDSRRMTLAAAVMLFLALESGCVERRLTVRSNPPGAQLYVDDYEIGTTPCSVSYTYYGTRKIRLVKDGYETAVVNQPIPAPWYQYFPIDFVTENLVPGHIRDERVVTYQMQPSVQVPSDQLVARAESLRQNGRLGAAANAQVRVTPPPATSVPAFIAPPNTLPAPTETIPSPAPAPISPQGQFINPPGTYPPPGGYAPAPAYVPTPGFSPAPAPYQPQPSR